ncbi:helix-turn-helix transcriptional regulator [Solihabitans fulvus]|uniref:Helix-turn-helix transcriptional regulator n=1 Tax=Solihabitans fulvus TaxID=1892852 RepID=A0A5B2XDN9_9PSEU|nr:helix-turn-helix transcriptional regulator [Solihabitans fulvus]KAA2261274.1 helix-turn-helix transcriptional regulator [Solihabitans fulvus]
MDDRRELGRFLQSRRAGADPALAGIHAGARRRVRGLRREEVAQLAGISVEYYVRLEQGRAVRPSDEVLDAIVRALRLNDDERAHLQDLARPRRAAGRRAVRDQVRPELAQLLAAMDRVPAMVLNFRTDVLAWNPLAARVFLDFDAATQRERNLARFVFLEPASRDVYLDWDEVASATVGGLRLAAGRHPGDDALVSLLGELSMTSDEFRTRWAGRDVQVRTNGAKRLRHPLVGELALRYENFDLPDGSGQRLITLSAEPASPTETALQLLSMWTSRDGTDLARPDQRSSWSGS